MRERAPVRGCAPVRAAALGRREPEGQSGPLRYLLRFCYVCSFLDAASASKLNSHWAPKNASFQWPIPNCSRVSTVRVRVHCPLDSQPNPIASELRRPVELQAEFVVRALRSRGLSGSWDLQAEYTAELGILVEADPELLARQAAVAVNVQRLEDSPSARRHVGG